MITTIRQSLYNQFNNAFMRMGFIKADQIPRLTAQMLFAGEGQLYHEDYMSQTEVEIQRLAVTNPWVYSNIMLIAKRVALGRLMVEVQDENGVWAEDPTHELTTVFEETPNPYMGQMFIWTYQIFWFLLRGEAYWMQIPKKSGDGLAEVYPLPADRIEPIPSDQALFSGFQYTPTATGNPMILKTENVIYHRLPNPFNYNRGLSPLTAHVMGLQIDREAQKFDLEDFKQGLTLKHIISLRPEISDVDMLRYQREIDDATAAGRRFMVTRGGDIKAVPVTVRRGSDTQSDNVRLLTKKEADYVYGVPEGYRTASATQANATVAERSFAADTIWPVMKFVGEDITVQSLHVWYEGKVRATFEDPRIADREAEIADEEHRWTVMTLDEVREEEGLDPYHNREIGKEKFTVADDLVKMVFEAEITKQAQEKQAAEQEKQAAAAQDKPPQEVKEPPAEEVEADVEANPEPSKDDKPAEEETLPSKTAEFDHWFSEGWLPSGGDLAKPAKGDLATVDLATVEKDDIQPETEPVIDREGEAQEASL